MLYLAIVSLFTTSESGSNPSDGFCILLSYFVHNVPDLCKEDLVVHISSFGCASLLCKPFWYSMCNEAELFSQLYSFDYIGSLVSAKARRGDKIKAHLLSHICLCDSLGADNQVV